MLTAARCLRGLVRGLIAITLAGAAFEAQAQSPPFHMYNPADTAMLGDIIIFAANDGVHGVELWRTDGSAAGTYMIADIDPGTSGSYPNGFVAFKGRIYFNANNDVNGAELWSTDGTAQNTGMLLDINPGPSGSNPFFLTVKDAALYFQADDGVDGPELWATDGTPQGTMLVEDIKAGGDGAYPMNLAVFSPNQINSILFFSADDGINGRELWESFGPLATETVLVKDINPTGSSFPSYMTQVGALTFFAADDGVTGSELWRTDGSPDQTVQVRDINPGVGSSLPQHLTAMNGILYFTANDGVNGAQLWRSDGTPSGTYIVRIINAVWGGANPSGLNLYQGRLQFNVLDRTSGLTQPWISDGTAAGTVPVAGTNFGSAFVSWSAVTQTADGSPLTNLAGYRIYFGADPGNLVSQMEIDNATATSASIQELPPGTVYFQVTAFTTNDDESDRSAMVSKIVPASP